MNVTLAPPKVIPMSWERYVAQDYNRAHIPWEQYRYSRDGVIEVPGEALQNVEIAIGLFQAFSAEIARLGCEWRCYINSISLEVQLSDKEERIPNLIVITNKTHKMIGAESRIVTLDMPAPVLVMEAVSPSSIATDLRAKELEYRHRGVGEYISIDWRNKIIVVRSSNEDGSSYNYNEFKAGQQVALKSFPELSLSVDEVIAGE